MEKYTLTTEAIEAIVNMAFLEGMNTQRTLDEKPVFLMPAIISSSRLKAFENAKIIAGKLNHKTYELES